MNAQPRVPVGVLDSREPEPRTLPPLPPRDWRAVTERSLRITLTVLGLIGLVIAGYLSYEHYFGGDNPVCFTGGGCETVQHSDYAKLAGLPVPLLGLFGYITVLIGAALPGDAGRLIGVFAGLVGFMFSVYLTYLELFVIHAICQWCVASAVVMTIVFIVSLVRGIRFAGAPTTPREPLPT